MENGDWAGGRNCGILLGYEWSKDKPLSMLDLFKTNQKSNVPHTEGTNEMNLNDIPLEGIVDYQAPQQELVKQSKSISEQMFHTSRGDSLLRSYLILKGNF